MYNNDAQIAGSAVYGGSLENCFSQVCFSSAEYEGVLLVDFFAQNLDLESTGSISSDPFQECTCEDRIPNCNISELTRQVYPGELLHFPVVAAGQGNGIVHVIVQAFFTDTNKNTSLAQYQDTQHLKIDCTDLHYQIQSSLANSSYLLSYFLLSNCMPYHLTVILSYCLTVILSYRLTVYCLIHDYRPVATLNRTFVQD